MTIVAYKDGIIASDSQVESGNLIVGTVPKITRMKKGGVAGASGRIKGVAAFLAYARKTGFDGSPVVHNLDLKDSSAFFVLPDRTIWIVEHGAPPYQLQDVMHAEGAGREVAIGAMEYGASAREAVEIAIRRTSGCGGPILTMSLIENRVGDAGGPGGGGRFMVEVPIGGAVSLKCAPNRVEFLGGGSPSETPDSAPRPGPGPVPGRVTITNHTPPVPVEEGINVWSTAEGKDGSYSYPSGVPGIIGTSTPIPLETPAEQDPEKGGYSKDGFYYPTKAERAMMDTHEKALELERSQRPWSRIFKRLFR